MRKTVESFFKLLCFFTSIPMPRKFCVSLEFRSLYLIPLVGLVRGLLVAIPITILKTCSSIDLLVVSSIALLLHFIVQGFLHVDGFIDFSEALIASRFGVDPYKVVKDKYRGSYAIAIFSTFVTLLYATIYTLIRTSNAMLLLMLLVLSEMWSTIPFLALPYIAPAPSEGLSRIFKESVKLKDVVVGFAIAIVSTFILNIYLGDVVRGVFTALYSLTSLVVSIAIGYTLGIKTLGFVNGDVLGFAFEVAYLITILTYTTLVSTWI